jgi:hypothetical protein
MVALLGSAAMSTRAQAEIVLNTLTYSQNFDSLGTTNVAAAFSATVGTIAAVPNLGGEWDGAKIGGTGTAATNFNADNGAANSGSLYNFGTTGSSDRALGAIASGSNIMAFGFQLTNNTGDTIRQISISFTQENWRSSTSAVNTLTAGWALGGGSVTSANYLNATGFNSIADLNLVGPAPGATNGALDGNLSANQVARSTTLSGIEVAQGQSIFFRWQDFNDAGNDAGLAIDDFSLSVTSVPEPASLALMGTVLGAGGLLRFRRKRAAAK